MGDSEAVSMLKSIVIGAVAALVLVAIVVVLVVGHVIPLGSASSSVSEGPVVVGLVLPDTSGVATLRVADVYVRSTGSWTMRSVSPSTPVVVAGTGGSTLADAYSFGGGAGVARALRNQTSSRAASWVIVDEQGWDRLRAGAPLTVVLSSAIEVFDGSRLFSFPSGSSSISPTETPELLDGAAYLAATQNQKLRADVGDALASSLASQPVVAAAAVASNLRPSALEEWFRNLRSVHRVPGK